MEAKQKIIVIVTMLGLVGLLGPHPLALAGNLEPSAPPGPTMKTLDEVEPRVPIHASDLPLTITEPNSYYLAENINFEPNDANAITIEANDVTIDLMGYSIIGPNSGTGSGISINGSSNVEIRNGTVRDFGSYGIVSRLEGYKVHRAIGVRTVSNGKAGISFGWGYGSLVKECTAVGNRFGGIVVGKGGTVTCNTAYDNQWYGFYLDRCLVDQNTAYNNTSGNMFANDSTLGVNHAP